MTTGQQNKRLISNYEFYYIYIAHWDIEYVYFYSKNYIKIVTNQTQNTIDQLCLFSESFIFLRRKYMQSKQNKVHAKCSLDISIMVCNNQWTMSIEKKGKNTTYIEYWYECLHFASVNDSKWPTITGNWEKTNQRWTLALSTKRLRSKNGTKSWIFHVSVSYLIWCKVYLQSMPNINR